MWKSGVCPRDATTFFPQPPVGISTVIHSPLWRISYGEVINRKVIHIPQGLWRTQSVQLMRYERWQ